MIARLTYGLTAGTSRMVGTIKIVIIAMKSIWTTDIKIMN